MKLALFELRRFRRALLSRLALVVLTLIPLLYGALYLWAFWDPYGNLKQIPVALVNDDRPATAPGGKPLHAGSDLTDELIDRHVFAWHVTSYRDAQKGLEDGSYHLMFHIPADFSASLASPLDKSRAPEQGKLTVETNDATNYLSGLLARTAFTEIRAAAASSAAKQYFDQMLIGFTDLKAQTERAAGGAGQLADGTRQAHGGADQAASGADRAAAGADQLAGGLATANKGASDLATGLAALDAGSAQLADGSAQVAAGTQLLATKVDTLDDQAEPILRRDSALIGRAAQLLADGAGTAADHADALPGLAKTARDTAVAARDALTPIATAPGHDPRLDEPYRLANQAVADTTALYNAVTAVDIPTLRADLRAVQQAAQRIADAAPHLADDLATARKQVDQLNAGAHAVAAGADQLHQGAAKAAGGARTLDGGLYRLSTGARQRTGGAVRRYPPAGHRTVHAGSGRRRPRPGSVRRGEQDPRVRPGRAGQAGRRPR
jgi:putative membrane protein